METVKGGAPGANEQAPRSDTASAPPGGAPFARSNTPADPNELKPAAPDANELKPGPPDPNELKPTAESQTPAEAAASPPVQVNEIQQGQSSSSGNGPVASSSSNLASDQDISSSKKKKKKGLKKVVSF